MKCIVKLLGDDYRELEGVPLTMNELLAVTRTAERGWKFEYEGKMYVVLLEDLPG